MGKSIDVQKNPKLIKGWKNWRDDVLQLFFDGDEKRTH